LNKEILKLAIPNIISNISVPLLSTVDTALMGRMSELHIGAVGLGAMIFNFIYWNFAFLRMGTTGMTAQAYGRGDEYAISNTMGRAALISLIIAAFILLLQVPFAQIGFQLMNVSEAQMPLIQEYFYIRIWAAPATLGLYAMMGWYFGIQNAIYPLILTIVINVVNIVCSYVLVYHYGMEISGVALGTVIAQYVGIFLAIGLFFYKYKEKVQYLTRQSILKIEELKHFLSINRDIFIRTFCLTFAFGFFYSQSSSEGDMILAVNVILLQFLNWMSYGVDGFAFAAESVVGKYKGANDKVNLNKSIRLSFVWGMALALLFSGLYFFFGHSLLWIFTDQADVVEASLPYLFWMVLMPLLGTPCYIWDGVYIGLTASKAMRDTMLIALLLYLGAFYLLDNTYGNHGLWMALLLYLLMRGVLQTVYYWLKKENLK